MKSSPSTNAQDSEAAAAEVTGFSPWQQLKSKRISYLTLPLLVMATVTEFVILATGWKYQQMVCVPEGMGVTFFGIGPIGATILAVELLKLPLAIWTASRAGWQKGVMMVVGLPLICLLTFQLVKDMAVYEMGVAMTPASRMLEKASAEETKIVQLHGELAAIEQKKADRELKLGEWAANKAKSKAELEESLKRNDEARQDAITLTDYQKQELSEVEARQATIIKQFTADTEQLTKAIADLRARRETELPRTTQWNAEEARIDNVFKAKLAAYTNQKAAYEKDKAEYDSANFLKRQLMAEPVDPGVAPERESNTMLKSTALAELEAQIKAKEAELLAVNNKRRERIAQVDADARQLRAEFDRRSSSKRAETDRKREELSAAQAALVTEWKSEQKLVDQELATAVQKVDGIRAELDACRKQAEKAYEAREAAIRNTQVHRIATTVEIVRGLLMGDRPVSIKATAKERGDLLTDQISMVRIWVYPVLAFIVAFLPTLMVEIGFSTLFHRQAQRPAYRLGWFGRRLHWLYTRAGHQKILRAQRLAREASAEIAARDQALAGKEVEVQSALETIRADAATHEEQWQQQEDEWNARLAGVTDSLNQALVEKEALLTFQQAEIERQVQLRQDAWSDRLNQVRQEANAQRVAHEAERTALAQEHHKKLLEVADDWRAQLLQARRQMAETELAAEEKSAKVAYELKETLHAREAACSKFQLQAEALSHKLAHATEDAARELEKAARQEKHRLDQQQLEFAKTLRQSKAELEHQLKQREQEGSQEFATRLAQEQKRAEQDAHRREGEWARQLEVRIREVDARWDEEVQQRAAAAQLGLKQREQQLQAQAEVRIRDLQTQAEEQLRRQELEFDRQLDVQSHEAGMGLREELQQQELAFHARLKQGEQALISKAVTRETELQNQWASDLRTREEELAQQAESRVRATEIRLGREAQAQEELFQSKSGQRDQEWQVKLAAVRAGLQAQTEQSLRLQKEEADAGVRALRELEAGLRKEMQTKDEAAQLKAKQREQDLSAQLTAQAEARETAAREEWEQQSKQQMAAVISPFRALLDRAETERDEARQSAALALDQVQDIEKKLTEASSFLAGVRNGKTLTAVRGGRDELQIVLGGLSD